MMTTDKIRIEVDGNVRFEGFFSPERDLYVPFSGAGLGRNVPIGALIEAKDIEKARSSDVVVAVSRDVRCEMPLVIDDEELGRGAFLTFGGTVFNVRFDSVEKVVAELFPTAE